MTITGFMHTMGVTGGVDLEEGAAADATATLVDEQGQKYEMGDVVAKGGMGAIVRARDLNCRRNVAMKVMLEGKETVDYKWSVLATDPKATDAAWQQRLALLHSLKMHVPTKEDLARGDRRVSDLRAPHAMSLAAISKHVKVLERAGLVTRLRQGAEHLIQLRTARLAEAARWLDFYKQFWSSQLEELEALVSPDDEG